MTNSALAPITMTATEARECVNVVKNHLHDARQKAWELHERKGWQALGYATFKECCHAEFRQSFQHVYKLIGAYEVESHTGESGLPLRHVQQLRVLKSSDAQREAYSNAKQMAAAEGAKAVTERHVETSVKVVQAKEAIFSSRYYVLGHAVTTGDITAAVGVEMHNALELLKPKIRGDMVQLIAQHGLTCAALIAPLGEMFSRVGTSKPSKTLETVLATGCLGGIALKQATLTDLMNARREAQWEHIAEHEAVRQVEAKIVTVYRGDPVRTFRELKKVLSAQDGIILGDLFMTQL